MRASRSRHPAIDDQAAALVRARILRITGTPAAGAAASRGDDLGAGIDIADGTTASREEAEPEARTHSEPDAGRSAKHQPGLGDRLPTALRDARGGLDRPHVVVVALVVLLGVAGAVIVFGLGRPTIEPIEASVQSSGTPMPPSAEATDDASAQPGAEPSSQPPAATAGPMIVHVAGLVAEPGVVELPAGSRVIDAVRAAGGATDEADLTPINLARVLADGEQVVVTGELAPGQPAPPPPPPPPGNGDTDTASGGSSEAPVNLNTATSDQLDSLPGIGPTLSRRILDWRDENGGFTVVDELLEVSGIGEQRLADLDGLVTV